MAQTVAGDVVAQADGGDGDEHEVGGVQKRPLVLQDEEYQAWKDDWEKENLRKRGVSRDLSTLRWHKRKATCQDEENSTDCCQMEKSHLFS